MSARSVVIIFDLGFVPNFDHIYLCNESVGMWSYNERYSYSFLVNDINIDEEIDSFIERSTYRDVISVVTF